MRLRNPRLAPRPLPRNPNLRGSGAQAGSMGCCISLSQRRLRLPHPRPFSRRGLRLPHPRPFSRRGLRLPHSRPFSRREKGGYFPLPGRGTEGEGSFAGPRPDRRPNEGEFIADLPCQPSQEPKPTRFRDASRQHGDAASVSPEGASPPSSPGPPGRGTEGEGSFACPRPDRRPNKVEFIADLPCQPYPGTQTYTVPGRKPAAWDAASVFPAGRREIRPQNGLSTIS